MPYKEPLIQSIATERWRKRQNDETRITARCHRDEWTDRDLERIMDDDAISIWDLAKEIGRTSVAIHDMRKAIKARWVKELQQLDNAYSGPIVVCDDQSEQDQKNYREALRTACMKLTCSSIRTTEHEVGSEDHQFELMELYAMMGLME